MFIVAPPVSRARRITWASRKQECGSNLTFPYFFIYFFDCSLNKRGAKGRRGERRASRSGLERHTFTAQVGRTPRSHVARHARQTSEQAGAAGRPRHTPPVTATTAARFQMEYHKQRMATRGVCLSRGARVGCACERAR